MAVAWVLSLLAAATGILFLVAGIHSHLFWVATLAAFAFAAVTNPLSRQRIRFVDARWKKITAALVCAVTIVGVLGFADSPQLGNDSAPKANGVAGTPDGGFDFAAVETAAAKKFNDSLIASCNLTKDEFAAVESAGDGFDLNDEASVKRYLDGQKHVNTPPEEVQVFIHGLQSDKNSMAGYKKVMSLTREERMIRETESICHHKGTSVDVTTLTKSK